MIVCIKYNQYNMMFALNEYLKKRKTEILKLLIRYQPRYIYLKWFRIVTIVFYKKIHSIELSLTNIIKIIKTSFS